MKFAIVVDVKAADVLENPFSSIKEFKSSNLTEEEITSEFKKWLKIQSQTSQGLLNNIEVNFVPNMIIPFKNKKDNKE